MYCIKHLVLYLTINFLLHQGFPQNINEPLILTPLLNNNKIEEARNASKVVFSEFEGIESYSGFFTADERYNSNLFFWFFPSESDYHNDPVVLWLQGGPGMSSLFGLFTENGPFYLTSKLELKLRKIRWTKNHSVLYIDNPAGTGFSFTDLDGYARNQTIIGESLYKVLLQFFQLFPELQKNDFFLTGESYAGKYVPAVAYTIHHSNPKAGQKINLKGMAIGNGFSDPINLFSYSDYLYQHGMVDSDEKAEVKEVEDNIIELIQNEQWHDATTAMNDFFGLLPDVSLQRYQKLTGFINFYNVLLIEDPYLVKHSWTMQYLQRPDLRAAIHIGSAAYGDPVTVQLNLYEDFPKSVAPWIAELTNHYQVLIYTGQLDIAIHYPSVSLFLSKLNSTSGNLYQNAKKHFWYVNKKLAGYVKEAGNLTDVLVRAASHMAPGDQPTWVFDMLTKFTRFKQIY